MIDLGSLDVIHAAEDLAALSDVRTYIDFRSVRLSHFRLVGIHCVIVASEQTIAEQIVHVHHLRHSNDNNNDIVSG